MEITNEIRQQLELLANMPRLANGCFDMTVLQGTILVSAPAANEKEASAETANEKEASAGAKNGLHRDLSWACVIYPAYARLETTENKKEHYPDLILQMRAWFLQMENCSDFASWNLYLTMLYGVICETSPEIYEIYREEVEMLRSSVKKVIHLFDADGRGLFLGCDPADVEQFGKILQGSCEHYFLLQEKYEIWCH